LFILLAANRKDGCGSFGKRHIGGMPKFFTDNSWTCPTSSLIAAANHGTVVKNTSIAELLSPVTRLLAEEL
jgi:hypothetical protein